MYPNVPVDVVREVESFNPRQFFDNSYKANANPFLGWEPGSLLLLPREAKATEDDTWRLVFSFQPAIRFVTVEGEVSLYERIDFDNAIPPEPEPKPVIVDA